MVNSKKQEVNNCFDVHVQLPFCKIATGIRRHSYGFEEICSICGIS